MYQLLALLTGVTIAAMVAINGHLSQAYGVYLAAILIHIAGVLSAWLLCALRKEKPFTRRRIPLWQYLGGAIGVFTTLFTNFAFGLISMTSIVALGLLGQTVASLVIDSLGLFGMRKIPFQKSALISLSFALMGILLMLDRSVTKAVYAVFLSFGSGILVVLSRSVNARLANELGALKGSLINHLVGLPITIAVAGLAFLVAPGTWSAAVSPPPWVYLGGVLGVATVLLSNLTVPKLSAFSLTVLAFVGQFFAGILLDVAAGARSLDASFAGGMVIAGGLAAMLAAERASIIKARKNQAYWERLNKIEAEHREKVYRKYLSEEHNEDG